MFLSTKRTWHSTQREIFLYNVLESIFRNRQTWLLHTIQYFDGLCLSSYLIQTAKCVEAASSFTCDWMSWNKTFELKIYTEGDCVSFTEVQNVEPVNTQTMKNFLSAYGFQMMANWA